MYPPVSALLALVRQRRPPHVQDGGCSRCCGNCLGCTAGCLSSARHAHLTCLSSFSEWLLTHPGQTHVHAPQSRAPKDEAVDIVLPARDGGSDTVFRIPGKPWRCFVPPHRHSPIAGSAPTVTCVCGARVFVLGASCPPLLHAAVCSAAGSRVGLSIYTIHHDPKHYPDPETFRQEELPAGSQRAAQQRAARVMGRCAAAAAAATAAGWRQCAANEPCQRRCFGHAHHVLTLQRTRTQGSLDVAPVTAAGQSASWRAQPRLLPATRARTFPLASGRASAWATGELRGTVGEWRSGMGRSRLSLCVARMPGGDLQSRC